jgi:hypothetical protein
VVQATDRRVRHGAFLAVMLLLAWAGPAGASPLRGESSPDDLRAADERPATELRVALGRLLGEHAFLVMETMRAGALGRGEQSALRAALDDNSAELASAIGSVYGEAGGERFDELWTDHVDLLVDYAEAGGRGDETAADRARAGLDTYTEDFAAFLSEANPELRVDAEEDALQLHIDQLTAFADADYARAYQSQREAFGHMFELGDHLALAIARQFPDRFPDGAVAFSPRADLRLALDQLLAEHVVLSAETMRAGVTEAPDFAAGRDALAANSRDLAAAVASVYGSGAGAQFGTVWSQHVDAYVLFVEALGTGDDDARAASLMELHAYHDQLSQLLVAVNPELDADAVAGLIRRHVQGLISQAEATAAGDHERSVAATRDAYDGMFVVGGALADAIAAQFPERFQDLRELPATATEAGAESRERGNLMLILGVVLAAVVTMGLVARGDPRSWRHSSLPR